MASWVVGSSSAPCPLSLAFSSALALDALAPALAELRASADFGRRELSLFARSLRLRTATDFCGALDLTAADLVSLSSSPPPPPYTLCIVDAYAEFGRRDESFRTPALAVGSFSFSRIAFSLPLKVPGRALGVLRDARAERGRRLDFDELRFVLRVDDVFGWSPGACSRPRTFCLDAGTADCGLLPLAREAWWPARLRCACSLRFLALWSFVSLWSTLCWPGFKTYRRALLVSPCSAFLSPPSVSLATEGTKTTRLPTAVPVSCPFVELFITG